MFEDLERRNFSAWVPILRAVAKPARHPQFHELTHDGEWKNWSSYPELSDEEPLLVKQPDSSQAFWSVRGAERCELSEFWLSMKTNLLMILQRRTRPAFIMNHLKITIYGYSTSKTRG
jgi:hypothetical protein